MHGFTGLPNPAATVRLPLGRRHFVSCVSWPALFLTARTMSLCTWSRRTSDISVEPTSRPTPPRRTARRSSEISSRGSTETPSASLPSIPPKAGRTISPRTSQTRCSIKPMTPTIRSRKTRSALSIGTSPRERNGRRRRRFGAETIRPSGGKPEQRIDPDAIGRVVAAMGNSHARARHQGRCQAQPPTRPRAPGRRPPWTAGGGRYRHRPARIIDALKVAIRAGAAPADLGQSLAYGAALRVARFGKANEHADWETAHHVFTYANAVHQMLKRIGTTNTDGHAMVARGVLHGAMALYLARYLNVPPARIPGEGGDQLDDLPADVIR